MDTPNKFKIPAKPKKKIPITIEIITSANNKQPSLSNLLEMKTHPLFYYSIRVE